MKTLYLCGAGNPEGVRLALSINNIQKKWEHIIILDDDSSKHNQSILDIKVAGPFALLEKANPDSDEAVNLVSRKTRSRDAVMKKIKSYGLPVASLIHPSVDTFGVKIAGSFTAYQQAILGANSTIGEGSVVFMRGLVGHGARLDKCCVVAPGAVINARAELAEGVYVGSNASILPDLKIGAWATIGANSSVIQDVPAEATATGVPAQNIMPYSGKQIHKSGGGDGRKQQGADQSREEPSHGREVDGHQSEAFSQLRQAQANFIKSHRLKNS